MVKRAIKQGLLFHKFSEFDRLGLFAENYETPSYLKMNLKDKLRAYQDEALRYLHYSQNHKEADVNYKHLLFHMATGSGKTMVMAGAILYLFKEYGYQNFIFFVHTDAIIQKTKENLLNKHSSKYLFNQSLEIDGEKITIEAVETFPVVPGKNTIYLKLSTIHKIHDELNGYRENSVTYEDLTDIPLVLLGDEAHHFNAKTKARGKAKSSREYEELTWENTIDDILALNDQNRLLEFTATIDLNNKEIYQKYKDKIIYQYDLKRFMLDGFSKKVMLMEANQSDKEKMLDAVLLSQYRKFVAIDHGVQWFKPIILFKSNLIGVSNAKQGEFVEIISNLSPNILKSHLIQKKSQLSSSSSVWHRVIKYYEARDLLSVVEMIQEDFNEMNLLNVNKTDLMEEQPVLLNTLEEIDNPIRAVFAVAKVNEGWDVLNLYDIVRISERASSTKSGTDSEAQLIGRGARYYPFVYNNKKSYTRRFDLTADALSILEQLHYHTINETTYISRLHKSLEQADIIADTDGAGIVEHAELKREFKNSQVYKLGKVFFNEVIEIENKDRSWESYSLDKYFKIPYKTTHESSLDNLVSSEELIVKSHTLELRRDFWFKALQRISFYKFNKLKKYFPNLSSIQEFIENKRYLGSITIDIELPVSLKINDLSAQEKLHLLENVLIGISNSLKRNYQKYKGTYGFIGKPIKDVFTDYSTHLDPMIVYNQKITSETTTGKKWYVYDKAILNQLEHRFVGLIGKFVDKLKLKYDDIYLIRNDEKTTRFKLTEFGGIRGFMPDFIMILTNVAKNSYYQVFLEPKGDDRLKEDAWKQRMLEKINDKDRIVIIGEDENIRLVGVKFFADGRRQEFIEDFEEKINDGELLEDKSLVQDYNFLQKDLL